MSKFSTLAYCWPEKDNALAVEHHRELSHKKRGLAGAGFWRLGFQFDEMWTTLKE